MEIIYRKSFLRELKKLPEYVQLATYEVLKKLLSATNLAESGVDYTKMEGTKKSENYYRIRVGDYRIGIEYVNPDLILITIVVRGQIYKEFPPGKKK